MAGQLRQLARQAMHRATRACFTTPLDRFLGEKVQDASLTDEGQNVRHHSTLCDCDTTHCDTTVWTGSHRQAGRAEARAGGTTFRHTNTQPAFSSQGLPHAQDTTCQPAQLPNMPCAMRMWLAPLLL